MSNTLWVFAYGSLIWDPGFSPAEQLPARLTGYQRRFCLNSLRYRGTFSQPGLVLALDAAKDATCNGVALAIPEGQETEVLKYLRARELFNPAYREITTPLTLADGREIEGLTYVVNRDHEQYDNHSLSRQAEIIAHAAGERGPNCDYLWNTADHLRALGIADENLDWLSDQVRTLQTDQAMDMSAGDGLSRS
ncbi:gamma-glutamylcyclotransferase [Phaeobacter porticola]|uniref:glutathione-specific gamma-glutamylcyclotransferase n=1 Tax=Phaeobacter porticola TaxID=1844006 RepID=A0A1L3IAD0_9RHOB|nr:gamma-glutamylcyclotransferase [Phaeobacter porticola]APG48993.1 putative cation transort protein [Phaeobacter porticola]